MSKTNDATTPSAKSSVVSDTADQIRDRAGDAAEALKGGGAKASSTAQDMNDKAGLIGTAKDMASDAGDKVNDALEDHKAAGAERVKGISGAMRRAADELEDELPPAATYIRRAADEIDSMADAVQRRDVRQLVDEVQSFARRQPAAFLGATVLGGFAVMRLLRTPTAAQPSGASSSPSLSTGPSSTGPSSTGPSSTGPSTRTTATRTTPTNATSSKGISLAPVGGLSDLDDSLDMGGSGDQGGFEPTAGSASARTGRGTRAGR